MKSPSKTHLDRDARTLSRANEAYSAGAYRAAVKLFEDLLSARPDSDQLLHTIGTCYGQLGEAERASDYLERAIRLKPSIARWCDLATARQLAGRMEDAWAACAEALRIGPRDATALCTKANIQTLEGDAAGALATLAPSLEGGRPAPRVVIIFARCCLAAKDPGRALPVLDACLAPTSITDDERAMLVFCRGDVLDRLGRYDEAFAAYEEANAIRAARTSFDPVEQGRVFDRIIATWSTEAVAAAPRARLRNNRPVFIVGMPRSGTSLIEQILSCHPDVFAAGEIGEMMTMAERFARQAAKRGDPMDIPAVVTARELEHAARDYLKGLSTRSRSAKRVTDKLTLNFLFLGLVQLALPGAHVIHCVRDPLDTCLSCFFQDFSGGLPFAWNLEHVGAYHRGERRLMAHWKSTLELPMLDVVYEDLVASPERVIRGMLEFLGLEWNEACLRFHESRRTTVTASNEQVRQPLYRSSVRRHEHYDAHLGPLRRGLEGG